MATTKLTCLNDNMPISMNLPPPLKNQVYPDDSDSSANLFNLPVMFNLPV